jgi:hypothetical protein
MGRVWHLAHLPPVAMASNNSKTRSKRLRRQGRITPDGDLKEAHRKVYLDNESLRNTAETVQGGGDLAGGRHQTRLREDPPSRGREAGRETDEAGNTGDGSREDEGEARYSKASVLIEIMSATPMNIESTIARHADSIDPDLLHLLEGRIAAARQLEQDEDAIQGLIALYGRLKSEYDRRTASPALRLLDTLLMMMMAEDDDIEEYRDDPAAGGSNATERTRKTGRSREDTAALIRARMQLAFDDSLSLDTDVFTVAQQLAVGETRFVDEMINEQVDGGEFVREVEVLLKRAGEQQAAGKALMASLEHQTERERVRQVLEQREKTITCVEELLVMARQVWWR